MRPFIILFLAICVVVLPSAVYSQPASPTYLHGGYFSGKVYLGWYYSMYDNQSVAFHVYRTDNGGSAFSLIARTWMPYYADSNVVTDGDYHYYVTAVAYTLSDSSESLPSDTVDVHTVFHPAPPQELFGYADSAGAHLGWQRPANHDSIIYYNIYRWTIADTTPARIGSSTVSHFTDASFNASIHTFYGVTAVYLQDSAESGPSNIIGLPNFQSGIMFTSKPVKSAFVGKPYAYQATVATIPPGQHVCFQLEDAPTGMTIDSTGLVTWTPDHGGIVQVSIHARLCDSGDGEAEQEYYIFILNGAPGSINGFVQNQHGDPVPGVRLKLFDVHFGEFALRTYSDSSGHYSFPVVNPSTYLLRAIPDTGSGYGRQWYNGATDIHDATPITVAESSSVVINVTLTPPPPPPPMYTLSGHVRDDSSHPVPGAHVDAFSTWHDSTDNSHIDGDHDDRDPVQSTTADSNGYYTLHLRAGTYILGAHEYGFYPQFYDHKATPLDADAITLASDTTGISFDLHPFMHGTGVIAGTIYSRADSSHLRAFVAGFHRPAPDSAFDGMVVYAHADTSGRYALKGLIDGYYLVLAVPREDFVPTFYSTGGGTAYHDSATAVQIASNDSVGGIDIYAIPDSAEGLNSIAGHVETTGGSRATPSSASPAAGEIVVAADLRTGAVAGSAISSTDGSYAITGLAPGSYLVTFEKPGTTTSTSQVTLAYANNSPTTATVDAQISSSGGNAGLGMMSVTRHWNLVSVPVDVSDQHAASVFPSAASPAFGFAPGGGYATASVLDYASGYWMRFSLDESFTIGGTARTAQNVPLSAGWNLIGSISTPVATSSIATTPAGILASEFFGYNNGYAVASSIQPGQGYWVKASTSGSLTLSAGAMSAQSASSSTASLDAMNSLTISGSDGASQTLFFGPSRPGVNPDRYNMPPLPPEGGFDARFASQRMLEVYHPAVAGPVEFPIVVQSTSPNITIQWNMRVTGSRTLLVGEKGNVLARLSGTGTATIPSTSRLAVRVESARTPASYALYQNYPNPFNPSTRIGFALPEPAVVTLRVYNLLGQVVAEVIHGARYEAGTYEIPFDASALSTGVYLYRLQAGPFSQVRKMILLK